MTFRNSKWSDYSIKNINNQWVSWPLTLTWVVYTLLVFLFAYFILFNYISLSFLEPYYTFFSDHYNIKTTLWVFITEALPAIINEVVKITTVLILNNGPLFVNFIGTRFNTKLSYSDKSDDVEINFNNWYTIYALNRCESSFNPTILKTFYTNYIKNPTDCKPAPMSSITPALLPTTPLFWGTTTVFNNPRTVLLNSQNWELGNIFNENSISKLNGSFYLTNFRYTELNIYNLNTELGFLSNNMIQQSNTTKTVRWLYKYNVLHRKTLNQSHNLTLSKKLISSGFFDSKIMSNNLWFSDTYSKLNSSTVLTGLLKNQWNSMYFGSITQNSLASNSNNNLNLYHNNFNYLSLYESSFLFFNKRAYQFLGSNNNLFNTTPQLSKFANDYTDNLNLLNNQLLLSNKLNNTLGNEDLLIPYNHSFSYLRSDNPKNTGVLFSKDTLPIFGENDLLSGDILYTAFNIINSFNNPKQLLSFYDPHFHANDGLFIDISELDFSFEHNLDDTVL